MVNDTVLGAVVTFSDLTDRRRADTATTVLQNRLRRQADTDVLTGIGNRRRAVTVLGSLRPGDAVVMIDIDNFKTVNDTHGHPHGDHVLAALAGHLQAQLRAGDSVTRYGGDEFLVVLRAAAAEAHSVVERMAATWAGGDRSVTFSAGIAIHQAGQTGNDTLRHADTAMYQAKTQGRRQVVLATT